MVRGTIGQISGIVGDEFQDDEDIGIEQMIDSDEQMAHFQIFNNSIYSQKVLY